jgi:hypothetical protein
MKPLRTLAAAGALVGAMGIGAAVGVTALGSAGAQTATTTTPAAGTPATPPAGSGAPAKGGHGQGAPSGPHQANGKTETPLTGSDLDKVTAGVQAEVPGATIDRAETDADGDAYEAHITKPDGSRATVKFDESFNVTSVDDGMT